MLQNLEGRMITLLNGDSFYKEDILQNMQDDDYYYGFLGENALSSSSIKSYIVALRHTLERVAAPRAIHSHSGMAS